MYFSIYMFIVGVSGKKGHGKDTVADYLVENYNFKKIAFADPLKQVCATLFNFSDEQLYGDKKEVVDEYWKVTPRKLLQYVGTELLREQLGNVIPNIGKNIWIEIAKKKMLDSKHDKFVVSDVRFKNELDMVEDMKGLNIRVIRTTNNPQTDDHSSEKDLDEVDVNKIYNDGSFEELYKNIDSLMKDTFNRGSE